MALATELAEDAVLPSGSPVKRGELVMVVTMTRDNTGNVVSFATPGPAALAINAAIRASREAARLRYALRFHSPSRGVVKSLVDGDLPSLFDYFEQSMIAVTFSYQALEAFANQIITNAPEKEHQLMRKTGVLTLSSDDVERVASTEEKLTHILPRLTAMPSPKGKAIWAKLKKLKAMRDSTVHLKSLDQYRRGGIDRGSLYYRFLNTDPREAPRLSIAIMKHFSSVAGQDWLDVANGKLSALIPNTR